MRPIDKYFNDQTEKISFIELKTDSYPGLNKDLAYPLVTDKLIAGIKDDSFTNEINYDILVDGMIVLLSLDPDFKYKEDYIESLNFITKNLRGYVISRGVDYIKEDNPKALYYFRFLHLTGLESSFSDYAYAAELYKEYMKEDKKEDFDFLRLESIHILEGLTVRDEDFPLAYYELAKINAREGYFNKAYLYMDKAFKRVDDELSREEIRTFMEGIYPNVLLERGIDSLNRARIDEALDYFYKAQNLSDSALVNYYIGVGEDSRGELGKALSYYDRSRKLGGEFRELFQDQAIAYYKAGDKEAALKTLSEGLDIYYEESNLLYNRLVIYIAMGRLDKAKEDMDTLLAYGDLPQEILDNLKVLKNTYDL